MGVQPLSPERFLEASAAFLAEQGPQQAPEVLNTGAVVGLDGVRVLEYRGRRYAVPPVPYTAGLKLQQIVRTFERLANDPNASEADALATANEAVGLFASLVRRPWYARFLPNPFRRASDAEVGQLLHFFWMCRMSTGVRNPFKTAVGHLNPRMH